MGKKSPNIWKGALSYIYSRLTRPFRNFNITNRTSKVLSKDKPDAAPQYPTVVKQKELVNKMYPNFMENHYKKDMQLDDYLKKVYVTSKDSMKVTEESGSSKLLPQRRYNLREAEFPYENIGRIPEGKCSLQDALYFIHMHSDDPNKYTVEQIATEYKLDKQVVENILKYFVIPISLSTIFEEDQTSDPPLLKEK
ncbi:NADH dehydrogenase [ubiquinone] 1 alpha subcomplex assembly factor 4 [Nomia melanderi]|uniref:NADH dehydrogenase [ubiquinone] 1 alpha subcomplex assembly factor 4 n=1 Tax=Nomia melanderi TaxID=2448451 RepID=UPI00130422B5|nr:NADH dehydrogenase [ubiquinone] 1 alpha subcomplex assembly factor 4 [Nomia melanderi]